MNENKPKNNRNRRRQQRRKLNKMTTPIQQLIPEEVAERLYGLKRRGSR